MLYNISMDEKRVLIELIKSIPGGDVAAAAKIGVSVGLLRAMRQGRREISDKTARKFGYTRRVVYERIPAPADADTATRGGMD